MGSATLRDPVWEQPADGDGAGDAVGSGVGAVDGDGVGDALGSAEGAANRR